MIEDVIDHCDQRYEDADVCRDQLSVPVHKEYNDQRRKDQSGEHEIQRMDENVGLVSYKEPEQCVQRLNYRVAGRNLRSAGAALALQDAPANNRDEVAVLDLGTAGHAVGVALNK